MSDVEAEIRRQMLEEQARSLSAQPVTAAPHGTAGAAPQAPRTRKKGVAGALAAAGAAIAKFWALILSVLVKFKVLLVALKLMSFAKILLGGGTMLLSMWVYSIAFGWKFAVGFVLLIFIHESGHALAARKLGLPVGIMVFIPMCGAFVTARGGRNVVEQAFIGIMGPVFGTLGGIGCCIIFFFTQSPFWLALAAINFWMNLLNLTPSAPLDGGWIAPIFSPKLLLPGVILLFFTFRHNPMVWVLAFMSLPRILMSWKLGTTLPYFKATTRDRWKYGTVWMGLAIFLAAASTAIHIYLIATYNLAM